MDHSTKTPQHRVAPVSPHPCGLNLTRRDHAVLSMLALRLKTITVHQLTRTWWTEATVPVKACRVRIGELVAGGLLEMTPMLAHPELTIERPLVSWQPGLPRPDLGSVSHGARTRWGQASATYDFVSVTDRGAACAAGEAGRQPRTSEATHDLHVAGVYLLMRRELPTRARSWRSEVLLAAGRQASGPAGSAGSKLPDAMVRDGRTFTAIEFVGDYATDKLNGFHEDCRRRNIGYELW